MVLAAVVYDSVRTMLTSMKNPRPELRVLLGISEIVLGRPESGEARLRVVATSAALREDADAGPELRILLATGFARAGDHDAALDQLEGAMAVPSSLSPPLLRLDPTWDPLRGDPRVRVLADQPDPTLDVRRASAGGS